LGKQNPKIYKIGVLNESKNDWKKTSWENEKGQKVTLPQLLDIIKDYPIIQAPIGKIKKIVINDYFKDNIEDSEKRIKSKMEKLKKDKPKKDKSKKKKK
jgi:hypothetical protein